MKKRFIALALTLLMLCTVPVFALPAETTGSVTASYSGGKVTFSGSVTGDVKAVAVLLLDPDGDQIAMTTCAVTVESAFSGNMNIKLTNSGSYSVKVADYEGGAFFAEDTFYRTAPSSRPSSSQSAPATLYMVGVAPLWENPFADVSETDWFYNAVRFVHENSLMVGTGDTAFSPQANTSRGMIVTILHRLEDLPEASAANPFDDVAAGKWYTDAVIWAAEQGIVSGYGNDEFRPEDAITREQMAAILMNYAKFKGYDVSMNADLSKYKDAVSISSWAKDAVSWANATVLIQGDGTNLMPTGNAERCQVAAILQRFIENLTK